MSATRKIPATSLADIRARRDAGESLRSIGRSYGVSHVAILHALAPAPQKAGRLAALEKVAEAARAERAARRAWQAYLMGGPVAQGITVADAVEALDAALAELDKAGGS